jgi:hypothetical protein
LPKLHELKSPLQVDKDLVKELAIPLEAEVSPVQKLGFLQAQLSEMQSQAWRERVNVIHAVRLQNDDDEAIRMKGNNNIMEHKRLVRQFSGGIVMIKKMIEELRTEYPELAVEE